MKPLGSKLKKAINENVQRGQFYENVKVVDISNEGLALELQEGHTKAYLPKGHLSDSLSICDLLLTTYKVDDILPRVLCFEKDVMPMMTLKPSLMTFTNSNLAFEDLHEGLVFPTVVSNVKNYGVFVKLPVWKCKKAALIPLRHLSDEFIDDPNDHAQVGQTLYAKIIETSESDQKITMTSKSSEVNVDNANLTVSLFKSFQSLDDHSLLKNYEIGSVVNCVVKNVNDFGLETIIDDEIRGIVPLSGMLTLEKPSNGQVIAGVILYKDYQFGVMELNIQPDIIKKCLVRSQKKRPKEGSYGKATCVLKRTELEFATFCIKAPNHFQGHFVHCPMPDGELVDLYETYSVNVKHTESEFITGTVSLGNKKKMKRLRQDSEQLENKSPPKKAKVEDNNDSDVDPSDKVESEEGMEDPGWDANYNPWGTGSLTQSEAKVDDSKVLMETKESSKTKTHLSKKQKKELDRLEAIAIEEAEKRAVEGELIYNV